MHFISGRVYCEPEGSGIPFLEGLYRRLLLFWQEWGAVNTVEKLYAIVQINPEG